MNETRKSYTGSPNNTSAAGSSDLSGVFPLPTLNWEHLNPPTCLPALHGVLFEIRLFLAGTSSGTSADVRESDRGERDGHLSLAGVCQRSLKMWLCSMTISLCSMRWPHSQPLFTMFHADLSKYRIGNVQKRTAPRKLPPQAAPKCCSMTIALCSMRWP